MDKQIFWHLPGFCRFLYLNNIVIDLMREFPEKFRDGYAVGSVYGTFPGAIWNGGRTVLGSVNAAAMENILRAYNSKGVPVRFTWTNSLLKENHLGDEYCNQIMRLADNGLNQVLVNRPVLEEYIRKEYPSYPLISSTTKRMTDEQKLSEELAKDYKLVVLDYDLNKNEEVLENIRPYADKIEILVNEICYPNCPKRAKHYEDESKMQLLGTTKSNFHCTNKSTLPTFAESKKRPAFISNEEIPDYIDKGFVNFKIVGRGLPQEFVEESYLYFLVKDGEVEVVRKKIDKRLASIKGAKK